MLLERVVWLYGCGTNLALDAVAMRLRAFLPAALLLLACSTSSVGSPTPTDPTPVVVGTLGLLVERFLIRRLYGRSIDDPLLLTFALSLIMVETVRLVWGRIGLALDPPAAPPRARPAGFFSPVSGSAAAWQIGRQVVQRPGCPLPAVRLLSKHCLGLGAPALPHQPRHHIPG